MVLRNIVLLENPNYSETKGAVMSNFAHIQTYIADGIPEIDVSEVQKHAGDMVLIDVRRADEFNGELGHI
jgi:3-mercaptopyruvate sulfurtransferase SseA